MKKCFILTILLIASFISFGNHLKGGWIYYENLGDGATAGTVKYRITVKQYLDCSSTTAQIDAQVYLGIFSGSNNQLIQNLTIVKGGTEIIQKQSFSPCISPAPTVCYRIDSYVQTVDLPASSGGYILAVQRCCRIAGIVNVSNSSQTGVSYTTSIPGSINGVGYEKNNSPVFAQKDTVVVCYNGSFTFDFSAQDTDNDSLTYSFCDGVTGGGSGTGQAQPNPPSNPPYAPVSYNVPYSGSSPMGSKVTINSSTGLISGIAPGVTGDYVVAVCASEFRNGVYIGQTKKEIHITVANCSLAAATLPQPGYPAFCESFTYTFENLSPAANITSYLWQFNDVGSGANTNSTQARPTHTYSDTGIFIIKLKVQNAGGCSDSASSIVRVYPGFFPDFNVIGSCFQTPFQFVDRTTTTYGVVNSWRWDFGDVSTNSDTSRSKNASYLYPSSGIRTVELITTNSKGCIDTLTKPVDVKDIPLLNLPFKDTLICSIDTLPLIAQGTGIFTWTPNYNIITPGSSNPLVYPKDTTTYVVTLNESGCIKKDSIKVNVLDFITVDAGTDTSICRTDSMRMRPVSYALQYLWSPPTGLSNTAIKFPMAAPATNTKYYVTANLGKCQARDSVIIRVAPYPQANAGLDTSICFGDVAQLSGAIIGSSFTWSPLGSLQNAATLSPVAKPVGTTSYILTAYDTIGCPKPFRDTMIVKVFPKIIAFAGNDTSVVADQPLQLNATGGTVYTWSPTIGMNNPNIPNPVIVLGPFVDTITYTVRVGVAIGCFATDNIKVRVFKTGPDIFVPSGFTPNSDGRNDILKPILVGMKGLNYFRIFNRWGKMIYSTAEVGKGWDGRISGVDQASGTFVYMAEGVDYLGNTIFRKGTIVLIR